MSDEISVLGVKFDQMGTGDDQTVQQQQQQSGEMELPRPRITRLPSLKELSDRLHLPMAADGTGAGGRCSDRSSLSLNMATTSSTASTSAGVGSNAFTAIAIAGGSDSPSTYTSPTSRLRLPPSAMMRGLLCNPAASAPAAQGTPLPGLEQSTSVNTGSSATNVHSTTNTSPSLSEGTPVITRSNSVTSPSLGATVLGGESHVVNSSYIRGYRDIPTLDQIRQRVSRGLSISGRPSPSSSGGLSPNGPSPVGHSPRDISPAGVVSPDPATDKCGVETSSTGSETSPLMSSEGEGDSISSPPTTATSDDITVSTKREGECPLGHSETSPVVSSKGEGDSISSHPASATSNETTRSEKRKSEYPLEHAWTIFFDSKTYKPDPAVVKSKNLDGNGGSDVLAEYELSLVTVGKFDTVEGFARHMNNIRLPSSLAKHSNYHMFKHGILPMWEDPANEHGGKWVILIRSSPDILDNVWANLTMALVGELLDPEDQVCGIVASSKPRLDRIQIWTRSRDNLDSINLLGKRIVDTMALEGREIDAVSLEFQYNKTSNPSSAPPLGKYLHIPFGSVARSSSSSNWSRPPPPKPATVPPGLGLGSGFGPGHAMLPPTPTALSSLAPPIHILPPIPQTANAGISATPMRGIVMGGGTSFATPMSGGGMGMRSPVVTPNSSPRKFVRE